MSTTAQRLYELLPAIYRIRDAEQGEPLKALIAVIAEQVDALEENLAQLYDDQFIETCAPWVIPYIGDLIGYRTLHGEEPETASQRAEVAHTIGFRRRKGTASMLEQLARDVTDWPARVVEFFELLATTQFMNHIRLHNQVTPDLRLWEPLERLNTPFETIPHTVDVRRITTREGKYNIPNVGIFLWRLTAYPLTGSPAVQVDPLDSRRYLFSPLGNNIPLFTKPEKEVEITHLAEPINVPMPISRRVLDAHKDLYYGDDRSLLIRVNGAELTGSEFQVCDLSDTENNPWAHMSDTFIRVDPELGRIAFPDEDPNRDVLVDFHYGFSADVGGGKYERGDSSTQDSETVQFISAGGSIQEALGLVRGGGSVRITDSHRYEETFSMEVDANARLELRANNEHRPTLVIGDEIEDEIGEEIEITGGEGAEVILDGLLITGGRILVPNDGANGLRKLTLRHCTLVPGRALNIEGAPLDPAEPSLVVVAENVSVVIDHCILGGIRTGISTTVDIENSIVDATEPEGIAFASSAGEDFPTNVGGTLNIKNSTVIGKVHAAAMSEVSNTIFFSALGDGDTWSTPVRVERKQSGCIRFSHVPPGSRVPRQYRCQPALAIQQAISLAEEQQGHLTAGQRAQIADDVAAHVRPGFTDRQYGRPGYCQLLMTTPLEIRTGADDESEMGVFHHLYQPQRETNFRVRLEEYLRFGLEAGIFYVT